MLPIGELRGIIPRDMLRKSVSALLFASIIAVSLASFTQPAKAASYYYTWDSATPHTRVNGAPIFWNAKAEADTYGFTKLYTYGGIGFGSVDAWADYYLTVTAGYSSTYVYLTYDAKGYWSTQGKVYLQIVDTTTGETVLDKSKNLPQSRDTVTRDTIGDYIINTVVGRQYRVKVVPIISALSNPFGFGGIPVSDYYNDRFIKLVVFAFYGAVGGCPTLFVWNGASYVDYGVIDIHNPLGEDIVREVVVQAGDVGLSRRQAVFRLREGWEGLTFSESFIDQIQLYVTDSYGNRYLSPLVNATHTRLGNVLPQLLLSDDWKSDVYLLETIDLNFVVPYQVDKIQDFVFLIEGHNMK